jgi:hypothetical protein
MNKVMLGQGFIMPISEKTKVSKIGGERIKEKEGKLSQDLGKPATQATEKELQAYIDNASSAAEKKKRVARVNLMKAHKKGHKAQGNKLKRAKQGEVATESIITPLVPKEVITIDVNPLGKARPAVVKRKHTF